MVGRLFAPSADRVKRPTYEDLFKVRIAAQLFTRTMDAADPVRLAVERVDPWLKAEAERSLKREVHACPFKKHRVREKLAQGDGIYVERCRCGAERVRDEREVTDWHRPLSSPQGASSAR